MRYIKKPVAILIVASILYGIFGFFGPAAYAAWMPVTITADNFSDGTLTFHWSILPGAKSAVITYHRPGTGDTAVSSVNTTTSGNKFEIKELKADYIYDISVTIYDSENPASGEVIGRGLLYYLPSITFTASAPEQQSVAVAGGGRESGVMPKLRLSWKQPRIYWDPDNARYPQEDPDLNNGSFIDASSAKALQYMEFSYNSIYTDNTRSIASLNYTINISTEFNLLNSGSAQASVFVMQSGTASYSAYVSGVPGTTAVVSGPDSTGFYSLELLGRKDEESVITDESGTDNVLPHNDILPGTVYYMNIRPIYRNQSNANVTAVTVGKPGDYNGSLLSGEKSYISTPIRFQMTKDSANNVYVKIYRINQGSLDLPRLFYEVQASSDGSITGDWPVKETLDDSYFSEDYAVTVITGVNPNNIVYYKIVVKSEGAEDRLESSILEYALTVDTDRPPLPTGVSVIKRTADSRNVADPSGTVRTVKSTDITLSWEKPLNWDEVKDDLTYHFLISTSQTDSGTGRKVPVYVNGELWGSREGYVSKYRLVKYIAADSGRIKDMGNRLEFTLDAFELFDYDDDPDTAPVLDEEDNGFPTFLVPNTVYYLQMYSTKAGDAGTTDPLKMSDRSVVVSFTTLSGSEMDVPLPVNLSVSTNDKLVSGGKNLNYIDLSFSKVLNIDWTNYTDKYDESLYEYNLYYDLFMNTGTNANTFIPVASTQDLNGDVVFSGADNPRSSVITARIYRFTDDGFDRLKDILPDEAKRSPVQKFGANLLPNTTYYFVARTRLEIKSKKNPDDIVEKVSVFTSVLPVTTVQLEVKSPDESRRKPLAPTDFGIALDSGGAQLLTDSSVTFSWTHWQDDVIYQIIRTATRVYPSAKSPEYENDPLYTSFLDDYAPAGSGDPSGKRAVCLDPAGDPEQNYPGKFSYDSETGKCTFTVDQGMYPNRLYYFSIKAIRVDAGRKPISEATESVWVSIPVTTSMIEAPAMLEAIPGAEISFFWTDTAPGFSAEDYTILVKGPSDSAYKTLTKEQSTIVKDADGSTYYGRITGLKVGTSYDVKVTKGNGITVYEKAGLTTRDGYHELEVRWAGKALDDYAGYEIAIMEEGGSEYTILSASDLESYTDKNGRTHPYYTEETARTVNNDSLYYRARIKSMDVELPGGIVTKQPLKSNTRYYIKVRAVKSDPVETDLVSYSKFIGPVSIRTEFSQSDYDNKDREEQQKAKFLDRIKELDEGYFWRIAIGNNDVSGILLREDRITNAMQNLAGDSITVDLTEISENIAKDEIYIPAPLIDVMKKFRKSLVIRTSDMELVLKPYTLDAAFSENVKGILERQEVRELYVKLDLRHNTQTNKALPAGTIQLSPVNRIEVQALGFSMTYDEMAELFHNKLYNENSGLVTDALNKLLNTYVGSGTDAARLTDQYTSNLLNMIEQELSVYIDSTIKTTKLTNTAKEIYTFDTPVTVGVRLKKTGGPLSSYLLYRDSGSWKKTEATIAGAVAVFNMSGTGTFVILAPNQSAGGVTEDHWAQKYIAGITAKYDLEDVFPGIQTNFMPENKATCREVILLYEKIAGKSAENTGLDIRSRLTTLGLDNIIQPNSISKNVTRQQTAAVLVRLFAAKKGLNAGSIRPSAGIRISDESDIGDKYYSSVVTAVDTGIMQLDGSGRFRPQENMTRAEVVTAFARLLELTGDI